jgi:hypothetical protein
VYGTETAHQDNLLMADVVRVNGVLGRYVLGFLDADAGRAAPLSTEDERSLAGQVAELSDGLWARAARRERGNEPLPLLRRAATGEADVISDRTTEWGADVNTQADLDVDACVAVRGTCPMEFTICGKTVEFHFGSRHDGFHFVFDAEALDKLLSLGAQARAGLRPHSTECSPEL